MLMFLRKIAPFRQPSGWLSVDSTVSKLAGIWSRSEVYDQNHRRGHAEGWGG